MFQRERSYPKVYIRNRSAGAFELHKEPGMVFGPSRGRAVRRLLVGLASGLCSRIPVPTGKNARCRRESITCTIYAP